MLDLVLCHHLNSAHLSHDGRDHALPGPLPHNEAGTPAGEGVAQAAHGCQQGLQAKWGPGGG